MINYNVLNKSCLLNNYDVCRYWVEVMCCQMTEPYSRGMWRVSSGSLTGETSELSVSNLHTSIVCVNLFVWVFFSRKLQYHLNCLIFCVSQNSV